MDENTKTTEQEQETTETGQQTAQPGADPASTKPAAADPAADPAKAAAGKTYTDAELEALKTTWQQEYEQTQAAEKDFAKMTPAQQAQKLLEDEKSETARLKAELVDRDLTDYARGKIADTGLPTDALSFVKGKDQADTDARIKAFSAMLAAGVQAGVEARFKSNGYTPRGTAATNTGESGEKKQRGVTINPGK